MNILKGIVAASMLFVSAQAGANPILYGISGSYDGKLYSYDLETNVRALVGTTNFGPNSGLTFQPSIVPTPPALLLFLTGFIGLLGFYKRLSVKYI